jgi:hypothetical protein
MTDPGKVIGFLDLTGAWDPSLALVMGGAVAVGVIGFTLARNRGVPAAARLTRPLAVAQIDRSLVVGSLVFGVGWGLAGFCPGPALVAASAGYLQAVAFVVAMIVGMAVHELRVLSLPGLVPRP